jgi:cell shape-determining protein MreC
MLITIIKTGLKGKSFYKDPKNFVEGSVKETAISFLIFPIIIAIAILALLFILSFTEILGGPFWLARIFFWVLLIGYALVSIPIYLFSKLVGKASQKASETTEKIFVESEIKE